MDKKGYFDFNATTPLHPVAREAWLRAQELNWQNPSSLYREAAAVKRKLEEAREKLGELFGAEPERLVFTSGATESNNTVSRLASVFAGKEGTVLTSGIEHPSQRTPLTRDFGRRVRSIKSLRNSLPDWDDFLQALTQEKPRFVSVMAANNECGVLLPWLHMAWACTEHGVPFHADASQWIGKMPAHELGKCCYVTGSAHKFGGPKGVGFLILRDEDEAPAFLCGGPQEEKKRAGTENYPAIAAMVAALEALTPRLEHVAIHQSRLRDQFWKYLQDVIPEARLIGGESPRLWNTAMFVLPRHDSRKWLARMDDRGFSISTGSACSSGQEGSSVVLHALGATREEMRRVVRVSGGWDTGADDWERLADAFIESLRELDSGGSRQRPVSGFV